MTPLDAPKSAATPDADFDSVTGQHTTGHVWDGIRELNRPLPRWWLLTFYATIVWAAVYVVLFPALPLIKGATGGLLGYSSRGEVEASLAAANTVQAAVLGRIAKASLAEIEADPNLLRIAVAGGRSAFLVNCVPCHGSGAAGSPGYANLNDDDWLWGGATEAIYKTIANGVRSTPADTRSVAMPAFGDGLLPAADISAVTEYVLSLSGKAYDAPKAAAGKGLFADYCAGCHGNDGGGNREFGAPALNDAIWLYAGDRQAIYNQISRPKMGVMPAWGARLSDGVVKELALYVHSLGGGETAAK